MSFLQKIGYDNAAAVAKKAHKEGCTLKVMIPTLVYAIMKTCFSFVFALDILMAIISNLFYHIILQEAALKLGVLSSDEFDTLVVPEKMIGPSD